MFNKKIYKRPLSVLLMSAFVLPGSGQFINGQIIKGAFVLFGTFIPLIWAIVHIIVFLSRSFSSAWDMVEGGSNISNPTISSTLILILLAVFSLFYFYGIIDSYIVAKERWEKDKS